MQSSDHTMPSGGMESCSTHAKKGKPVQFKLAGWGDCPHGNDTFVAQVLTAEAEGKSHIGWIQPVSTVSKTGRGLA